MIDLPIFKAEIYEIFMNGRLLKVEYLSEGEWKAKVKEEHLSKGILIGNHVDE